MTYNVTSMQSLSTPELLSEMSSSFNIKMGMSVAVHEILFTHLEVDISGKVDPSSSLF